MAKYLAIFNDQLDDFDINGFVIMTEKEMQNYEELATSITWEIAYPISDLELIYADGEELLSKIDFREITNEEFKALKKLFNSEFGTFINEDKLLEFVEDETDDDYDDEIDDDDDDDDDDGFDVKIKNNKYNSNDIDDNDDDDY